MKCCIGNVPCGFLHSQYVFQYGSNSQQICVEQNTYIEVEYVNYWPLVTF